jgi:hypothetical protein
VGTALVVGIVLYFGIRVVRIARTLEPQSESDQLSEQHQPVVVGSTRGVVVPASGMAENARIY